MLNIRGVRDVGCHVRRNATRHIILHTAIHLFYTTNSAAKSTVTALDPHISFSNYKYINFIIDKNTA